MSDDIEKAAREWCRSWTCNAIHEPSERVDSLVALIREQVEKAVLKYENAITWNTSCLNCAKLLDDNYAQFERIAALEKADAIGYGFNTAEICAYKDARAKTRTP